MTDEKMTERTQSTTAPEGQSGVLRYMEILASRVRQLGETVSPEAILQEMQEAYSHYGCSTSGGTLDAPTSSGLVWKLRLNHDCRFMGCLDSKCPLCQHNPNRRCTTSFGVKYFEGDLLKSKCGAVPRIELLDKDGKLVEQHLGTGLKLEIFIVNSGMFEEGKWKTLDDCKLLNKNLKPRANKNKSQAEGDDFQPQAAQPLLKGNTALTLMNGRMQLPDLKVMGSSEALLGNAWAKPGRKPEFRLAVRASAPFILDGQQITVMEAVSEGFVVTTRRAKTAAKAEVPSLDDEVGKIVHIGKETREKLGNIQLAAKNIGVNIELPPGVPNEIRKVNGFVLLVSRADGILKHTLQRILLLSKEQLVEAETHAMTAVRIDNRLRVWYKDATMDTGLMFKCYKGTVDLENAIALLQRLPNSQGKVSAKVFKMHDLAPTQLELYRTLLPSAIEAWWLAGHPGWAITQWDSETYDNHGQLVVSGGWQTGPEAGSVAASESSDSQGSMAKPPASQWEQQPPARMSDYGRAVTTDVRQQQQQQATPGGYSGLSGAWPPPSDPFNPSVQDSMLISDHQHQHQLQQPQNPRSPFSQTQYEQQQQQQQQQYKQQHDAATAAAAQQAAFDHHLYNHRDLYHPQDPQQQPTRYPSQPEPTRYPSQPEPSRYPSQQEPPRYPSQQDLARYPSQPDASTSAQQQQQQQQYLLHQHHQQQQATAQQQQSAGQLLQVQPLVLSGGLSPPNTLPQHILGGDRPRSSPGIMGSPPVSGSPSRGMNLGWEGGSGISGLGTDSSWLKHLVNMDPSRQGSGGSDLMMNLPPGAGGGNTPLGMLLHNLGRQHSGSVNGPSPMMTLFDQEHAAAAVAAARNPLSRRSSPGGSNPSSVMGSTGPGANGSDGSSLNLSGIFAGSSMDQVPPGLDLLMGPPGTSLGVNQLPSLGLGLGLGLGSLDVVHGLGFNYNTQAMRSTALAVMEEAKIQLGGNGAMAGNGEEGQLSPTSSLPGVGFDSLTLMQVPLPALVNVRGGNPQGTHSGGLEDLTDMNKSLTAIMDSGGAPDHGGAGGAGGEGDGSATGDGWGPGGDNAGDNVNRNTVVKRGRDMLSWNSKDF